MSRSTGRSWGLKFQRAFRGLAVGVQGQDSFYVHFPAAAAVLVLAGLLGMDRLQFGVLGLCITVVLAAEYMNSALEWLAKAVDERHNQDVGNALDIASAAVLVASGGAALVGATLFILRIVDLCLG